MKMTRENEINYENMRFSRLAQATLGEEALMLAAANLVRVPPSDMLTVSEEAAADHATEVAAHYAAEVIGKTDLAEMSAEEVNQFIRKLLVAYRAKHRELVLSQPPF